MARSRASSSASWTQSYPAFGKSPWPYALRPFSIRSAMSVLMSSLRSNGLPLSIISHSLLLLRRREVLQSHLVCMYASNLLRDVVPLVLHGRLKDVLEYLSILEGQLQLLVRLLGASLELVELLNQELDVLRHLILLRVICLNTCASQCAVHSGVDVCH